MLARYLPGGRRIGAALISFVLLFLGMPAAPSTAAATGTVSGHVIDAATGLPLQGVVVTSEGPSAQTATTTSNGAFSLDLPEGWYILITRLQGYESTSSDALQVFAGQTTRVVMSIQRVEAGAGARVIGRTTIRATEALQKASVISATVNAAAAEKQGVYRAADLLRYLPAVVNDSSDTATWGDDITLDIRGIGSLETSTLIDGHPTGANIGGYNFDMSPIFGLRDLNVVYGSGGGDLYGVDAIGGVVDMQTLDPTLKPDFSFTQGYGSFSKLTTALHMTGTVQGSKLGYAVAYGTQGQDGVIRRDVFYQPGAAYDQSAASIPAVRALGLYSDDSSLVNKGGLAKFRWAFAPNESLTLTALAMAWYDNKTGNGDGDYLPLDTALQKGLDNLASYSPPLAAPFGPTGTNLPNCNAGQFAGFNSGGWPNGYWPNGSPDGGFLCQTPQQWAALNAGYQGAGPAWQGYSNHDFSARWDLTQGKSTSVVDAFTNRLQHTYDRTFTLPFPNSPFWQNTAVTSSGFTASDNIATDANELGFGFYYNNYAYDFLTNGANNGTPFSMEDAFFVRDAFHPVGTPLTTYLNVWMKESSITNTSYVDPRLSVVYSGRNDVLRGAVGATSTQPTAFDLAPFSPNSIGALAGSNVCNQLISIGSSPANNLRPERGIDEELSWGHRFYADSQVQVTAYNANVYGKIYSSTLPFSQIGTSGIPGDILTQFENLLVNQCGYSPAQTLAFLGVSGDLNLGRTRARGIDIDGRQRILRDLHADYSYAIASSALESADVSVLQNNLALIQGAQLPGVPLHTYSWALDYQTPRNYEVRLNDYWISQNNAKNRPAYSWANLLLSAPVGPGSVNVNIYNVFQQNVDIRGLIGDGVPLALNQYATPSSYEPHTGASATELFGLLPRTIEFSYTFHTR